MRRRFRITAWAVAAGLLAGGCVADGWATAQAAPRPSAADARPSAADARPSAADARPYGAADTAFGLDVLRAWCAASPRANVVFSPASLATALGMAYLGARGETAAAMASVLHMPVDGEGLLAGLRARSAALNQTSGPGVTLAASNQIWADPALPPLRGYLGALSDGYGASLAHAPLLTNPQQSAQRIDRAVSSATRGQIRNLVSPGMLRGIAWVLTSALYMNADWAAPFPADRTSQETFTTATRHTVTAKFMHGSDYQVGRADGWTGVSLPYRGGKLSMLALLPPQSAAWNCAAPAAATLAAILAGHGTANIALPKTNLSSDVSLNQLLTTLGMGIAFSDSADFSGLSTQAGPIGFVRQAAILRVDEKGTVGSAATAIGIVGTALQEPMPPVVTFDRPYLLMVTSSATGEPLFVARVANP
jgi:serpin B